jgi:hypothetical protein
MAAAASAITRDGARICAKNVPARNLPNGGEKIPASAVALLPAYRALMTPLRGFFILGLRREDAIIRADDGARATV